MQHPFYVTTAIAYANGGPHIGHAYELIASDAVARFNRLAGKDVLFLSGTDEHGKKMERTAAAAGLTPLELANLNAKKFEDLLRALCISNDDFIRTTQERHKDTASRFWNLMCESDDIYKGSYSGWYSVRDEAFYSENETFINDDNSRCGPNGTEVEWISEETYFFRLSKYQDRVLGFLEQNPDFVGPKERYNEVLSFVKSGLRDFSVSRANSNWGIPVPNDPSHVMYVWVDALVNYVTATHYLLDIKNEKAIYWPASLHVIGKDIIRFHAVYWIALLMSAKLPLPSKVFAHGFVLNKGEKMSKSLGNVIDPNMLIDRFGSDSVRYFLLREIPFGQDGNCDEQLIAARVNGDLANGIGNLTSRSLSMIVKNCDSQIPQPGEFSNSDRKIIEQSYALYPSVSKEMDSLQIHKALSLIIQLATEVDRYLTTEAPWLLSNNDRPRMNTVLYTATEVLRVIGIMLQPFTPRAAGKILDMLSIHQDRRHFGTINEATRIRPGTSVCTPEALFPRV